MYQDLKPEKKKKNIKWIVASIIIILASVISLLISIYRQYYDTVINNQKEQLLIIAQEVSKELELSVERSLQNVHFLVETKDYRQSKNSYEAGEGYEKFLDLFNRFKTSHTPYISDMIFTDTEMERPLISSNNQAYRKICDVSYESRKQVALWKASDNNIAMSVMAEDGEGCRLYAILDVNVMYETMVSKIRLGDKGYVMVKDSDGIIIMHMLKEQLGIDVIEDRKKMYPDLHIENTGLVSMIENQKQGKEGVEIYSSYWWADENPSVTKKISAYTPADIGNGFLIVSAVIDYDELAGPLTMGVIKIVGLSMVILIGLLILFFIYLKSQRSKKQIEQENRTLNQLNQTLQTLHENEQIMAHQQRLQIIGTMTGGIAHEFNNLLTPIMGYAGLMLEMMERDNVFYEDVTEIYDSAEKAKEIIHQISSLSKRNMDTVFQYCDIGKLLTRVKKMAESIKPANVEVVVDQGTIGKGIFGNVTQLNQVLLNLIVNAIHAIGNQPGKILISYRVIASISEDTSIPEMWKQGQSLQDEFGELSIEDNGCGMDETTMAEIFQPFFTTKSATGGTGLGLSIVQNIVEAHKGVVLVESHVGKGTKFRIILPIASRAEEKNFEIHEAEGAKHRGTSILLVDDNPKVLKVVEKGLLQAGYQVFAVADPSRALDIMKEQHMDMVVTDDAMKEMNGLYLASKIRQMGETPPIIMLTGLLRKEVIEAKQSKIIEEYLIKPITVSSLIEVLEACLKIVNS